MNRKIIRTYRITEELSSFAFDDDNCRIPPDPSGRFLIKLEEGRVVRCDKVYNLDEAEKELRFQLGIYRIEGIEGFEIERNSFSVEILPPRQPIAWNDIWSFFMKTLRLSFGVIGVLYILGSLQELIRGEFEYSLIGLFQGLILVGLSTRRYFPLRVFWNDD